MKQKLPIVNMRILYKIDILTIFHTSNFLNYFYEW